MGVTGQNIQLTKMYEELQWSTIYMHNVMVLSCSIFPLILLWFYIQISLETFHSSTNMPITWLILNQWLFKVEEWPRSTAFHAWYALGIMPRPCWWKLLTHCKTSRHGKGSSAHRSVSCSKLFITNQFFADCWKTLWNLDLISVAVCREDPNVS